MTYTELKEEICNTWLQLSPEQMAQVRMALLEASERVGEYPRMREISRCSDLSSALVLLEKWMLLTPQKVDILLWLTEQVGPHVEMVRARIEQYKKLYLPDSVGERERQPNALPHHPAYTAISEYLSENLRGRWADLGRALGLSNLVAELLRDPNTRQKDKTYQILAEHQSQAGGDWIPQLLHALTSIGLNRQHTHIITNILPQ